MLLPMLASSGQAVFQHWYQWCKVPQLDIALTVGNDIQSPAVVTAKKLCLLLFYSCLKYSPHTTLFWVHLLDLLGSTKELKMVDRCQRVLGVSLSNPSPSQVSNLSPYLLASCIKVVLQWAPTGCSVLLADHRCTGNMRYDGSSWSVLYQVLVSTSSPRPV